MSEKLLPCPFCGGEALIGQTLDNAWYAMCIQDHCCKLESYWRTEAEALTAWNTRTAMQADAAPAICTWAPPCGGMAQNCSWKPNDHKPCSCQHPPVVDRVSTSSPVVAHKTPETSVKLRDAVDVYQRAYVTWVSDEHENNAAAYKAAAAVIEADREAVRAAVVAEIVAWLRDSDEAFAMTDWEIADQIEAKFGGRDV